MKVALASLVLLHVWVSEARWTAFRDHDAIAAILLRYSDQHDVSMATAARRLVWRYSSPKPWIRHLTADCFRPAGWPPTLRWSGHRAACLALAQREPGADPCHGLADGWRARGAALRRALRAGYEVVDCGPTANAFVRKR